MQEPAITKKFIRETNCFRYEATSLVGKMVFESLFGWKTTSIEIQNNGGNARMFDKEILAQPPYNFLLLDLYDLEDEPKAA